MKVPAHVVDYRPLPFPVGVYVGELGEPEDRWVGESRETLFLRLLCVNNRPGDENTPEVGARTMRDDVCLRLRTNDGVLSFLDIEEVDENTPFLFSRAAGLLTGLAWSLGQVTRDGRGNADVDMATFVTNLRDKKFVGQAVKFVVTHRTRERSDTGEEVTEAQIVRFAPAE